VRKTVLVTGATGFIGACLTRRLVEMKWDVHVVSKGASNKWRIGDLLGSLVEHESDLRDRKRLSRIVLEVQPTIIYHLATYGAYHFQNDVENIMTTNIDGTLNLLAACSEVGFDHFVVAGSSSEYGMKNHPMKETDVLEPTDFYGVAKAAATLSCMCLAKLRNLPINILRLFAVYGYYEAHTRLIPTVIRASLLGENPRLVSPSSVRDFIFVEDVIDAFLKAASVRKELCGEIYNVGFGKQYTTLEVVSKIIELVDANVRPMWGHAEPRQKQEPKLWVSDPSKIRRCLGWKPKYGLERGLGKTIEWFRRNLQLYQHDKGIA